MGITDDNFTAAATRIGSAVYEEMRDVTQALATNSEHNGRVLAANALAIALRLAMKDLPKEPLRKRMELIECILAIVDPRTPETCQ